MRFFYTAGFKRAYQALDSPRRHRVDRALRQLEILYAESQRPFGLGLKSLKPGIWEIRAGLADRILFRRKNDLVELLIVGNHDEIVRLLRQL
jgi:hypothetical protein